ncbi:hypothetical protein GCM10010106_08930 [Thermopolyspora flexuosa]|jgi:hypothetical protein|uniref:Uncharacterized protein n=1 Tax=Thermopolyspora flexuosa TaxID=103836 RepID=A0A543J012_9ACTN|nr:hypothetical protein [Thermopolyspora flexuosa]TQM76158.1 hypothetical protein FHX40_2883 [Thermopolyspora flexuosa]GGM65198.1 hypothetical protein GCM10010106_08930 [Thermopolyspora flexuosa]
MAWRWRYEDARGAEITDRSLPRELFSSQADAESWIGENWRDLLAQGVEQVTLLEDDRVEYSGMSLRPE